MAEMANAAPPFPFFVIGCPSRLVIKEVISPGILVKIADVDPEYITAIYILDIIISAERESPVINVYGNTMLKAAVGPIPGRIPTMVPSTAP
jgi:hypothetical protein